MKLNYFECCSMTVGFDINSDLTENLWKTYVFCFHRGIIHFCSTSNSGVTKHYEKYMYLKISDRGITSIRSNPIAPPRLRNCLHSFILLRISDEIEVRFCFKFLRNKKCVYTHFQPFWRNCQLNLRIKTSDFWSLS